MREEEKGSATRERTGAAFLARTDEHETVVLEDESRELKTSDHSERVDVRHILVGEDGVVLRGDVVGQVVVEDESKQPVEERKIHLLVNLGEDGLHHDVRLSVGGLPDVSLRKTKDSQSRLDALTVRMEVKLTKLLIPWAIL